MTLTFTNFVKLKKISRQSERNSHHESAARSLQNSNLTDVLLTCFRPLPRASVDAMSDMYYVPYDPPPPSTLDIRDFIVLYKTETLR